MSELDYDPFAQEVSTEGVSPDTVGSSNTVNAEGRFHVVMNSYEYVPSDVNPDEKIFKLPQVKFNMTILNGDDESQVEKAVYHRIWLGKWKDKDDKAAGVGPLPDHQMHQVLYFLYCFGVVGDEVFGQDSVRLSLDMFDRCEGTMAVVKITKGEDRTVGDKTYKGRYEIQWNSDVWSVRDEKVADVPKDMEALQYASTGEATDDDLNDL